MKTDILIVDDEADICEILSKSIIKSWAYKVQSVNSAEAALDFLNTEVPVLMICDISMPGKSGLELLQEIRRRSLVTTAVMLTAHAEQHRIIEALRLGAIDYITKPFDTKLINKSIPVWVELGERNQRLREGEAQSDPSLQIKMMDLIRLKNNLDRKKTG